MEVRTGGERYVPEHRFLAPEDNHTEITDYERRHPLAVRIFALFWPLPVPPTSLVWIFQTVSRRRLL